ncbi:MAG: flagellar M-ring protein FliF [Syntrophorhabdus sp.]|nr:flagellar M-ring protein FliF [Syntrophorhabdus sp.]OPY05077.1 MAG: Flagellar M-ring protein [Syntrophorhabdus sp. PtaB.Bin184]
MPPMDELLNTTKNYLKTTPKSKLYMYLFLFIALVGGSIIGLSFLQKETYQTLFAGLSTEDASVVVTKLKELKVPYKLGLGGTSVSVPKDKVYDVRLMLAGQNALPGGSGVGFELFDKTNYGMTEFMQNINYKRAIQGELSRTINQMPEVKASRVHIAIPEKTLFTDREKDVTASVFLKLRGGKTLSKEQVAGIVHLVSGSIEGLKADNVTIVDSFGKILYKAGSSGTAVALSGQQFELQKSVERTIEESVQSMLDRFMPANKSIIRANVELNLRKVEKVEEEFDPNKRVPTSERKSREKSLNRTAGPAGVPGVASNVPNATGRNQNTAAAVTQTSAGRGSESEREESQVTYEVSKTVKKIVEPYGDIKRLSVAIVLDGKYEKVKGQNGEELKYSPRSQKELTDIKGIVARAVGIDEARGDKIEVLNVPFETENLADEKGLLDAAERKEMIFSFSKYGFYALIIAALFFFVIKPILGFLKSRADRAPLYQVKDVYVKSGAGTAVPGGDQPAAIESKQQAAINDVMRDKTVVGSVIKEWVKEGT